MPDVVTALKMAQKGRWIILLRCMNKKSSKTAMANRSVSKQRTKKYVDSVAKHDVVFGVGPAGTGKTFLAVVLAILCLKEKAKSKNHLDSSSRRSR